jgi:3-methyladenine DNA glycosylase/8-oxoguanine DNA glycosylase
MGRSVSAHRNAEPPEVTRKIDHRRQRVACNAMARLPIPFDRPVDLASTLFPLRRGIGDPTTRIDGSVVWRTARTADGPVTIRLAQVAPDLVEADAWGPGDEAGLAAAPGLAGALDDDAGFDPSPHPVVADAARRSRVRLTCTPDVMPVLMAAICEQQVTGLEARRAWRGLVRATSSAAPVVPNGPPLLLPPDPERVCGLPSFTFHAIGLPARRSAIVRDVASRPRAVERLAGVRLDEVRTWLQLLPGIGPWTAAETARLALGDADAVSVGDYHLPNLVSWALAGEPRGTDERMLQLLEPFQGHRGRVQRLLEALPIRAPRYGPRTEVHPIER